MYTSYVVTILSSMCMDYVSLTWIYSIPHVMKGVTASDYHPTQKGVWPRKCVEYYLRKVVIRIRLFNCLIALEALQLLSL